MYLKCILCTVLLLNLAVQHLGPSLLFQKCSTNKGWAVLKKEKHFKKEKKCAVLEMLMLTNSSFTSSRRRCSFGAVFNSLTFRTVCSLFPWQKKKEWGHLCRWRDGISLLHVTLFVRQEHSIFPLWQEMQLATAAKHLGVGRVLHLHHSSGSKISKYESKNDHNP